jgi:DNA-binding IclR family transcriptional regulator
MRCASSGWKACGCSRSRSVSADRCRCTPAGPRALLAWEPESEWQEYAAAGLDQVGDLMPPTPDDLIEELQVTRKRGYAVSDEDVTPGIASLGAPILDYTGAVRAALSIGGMKSLVLGKDRDEFVRLLVDGARDISQALGYTRAE